jgi:maltose alpha-D-glucosyltransferase/alpha-amylase
VGEIHAAVSGSGLPAAIKPEPFSKLYQRSVYQSLRSRVRRTLTQIKTHLPSSNAEAAYLETNEEKLLELLKSITKEKLDIKKIRVHGDLRLNRFLDTGSAFYLADFEGNTNLSISERKIKSSAVWDIASLIFSLHEAIFSVLYFRKMYREEEIEYLQQFIRPMKTCMTARLWDGYLSRASGAKLIPTQPSQKEALLHD